MVICDSCEQKGKLNLVQSIVMPGVNYIICEYCSKKGLEPRWSIILAAASLGLTDEVTECIYQKKYLGEDISAIEII